MTSDYSNIRRRIKLEENSVLQLASVTKPITATVILQLIEEGKLSIQSLNTYQVNLNIIVISPLKTYSLIGLDLLSITTIAMT